MPQKLFNLSNILKNCIANTATVTNLGEKLYTCSTLAARTALTLISMSRKAVRTFSELS